jgi:hypothetical protein
MRIVLPLVLFFFCALVQASLKFDHYGVYVSSGSQTIELKPAKSIRSGTFTDLTRLQPENNQVTFYIFNKKFNPDKVFVAQSAIFSKKSISLKPKIAPMDAPDTYQVSVQLQDSGMPFLMLRFGGFFSAKSYLVAISDVEKVGVAELVANKKMPTRERLKYAREFLNAYPNNSQLQSLEKELSPIIARENAAARQRQIANADNRAFREAQAAQKRYKDQAKWVAAYKGYLQHYPTGLHAEQAKSAMAKIYQSNEKEKTVYSQQLEEFEALINAYIDAINARQQTKLDALTVPKSSASKSLKAKRLTHKSIKPIEATKFHYSNKKTRDWAYVNVSGKQIKQLQLRLVNGDWKVYQYRL